MQPCVTTPASEPAGAKASAPAWGGIPWFVLVFVLAALITSPTVVPALAVPAYSAVAGVGAAFVAASERRQVGRWLALTLVGIFVSRLLDGLPLAFTALVAFAVALECLVFRVLLQRFGIGPDALSGERRARIPQIFMAALGATLIGGVVVAVGSYGQGGPLWLERGAVRAIADLTGIMTVAPLAWMLPELRALRRAKLLRLALSALVLFATMHFVFVAGPRFWIYPYLPLALLVLAVVGSGREGVAALTTGWALLSIWYTREGHGPWSEELSSALRPWLTTQLYNLTAIGMAWLVAALLEQRELAYEKLAAMNRTLEERVRERTRALTETISALHDEAVQRHGAEARYRALFTGSATAMLLIDPVSGRILDANPAAVAYYGWSSAELCAKHISDINILDDAALAAELERARSSEREHFHFRHRLASGDVRDVEVHSGPITIEGQTLLYSIVHDVTEARQAERALRRSEKRFRAAFDGAPVGLVELSIDPDDLGRYLRVNEAFCQMVGYEPGALLGRSFANITHLGDVPRDLEILAQASEGKLDAFKREKRYVRSDGRVVWASVNASVLLNRDGKRYAIEHIEDVTERKQSQELVDLVFETSLDPLCTASFDGFLVRTNPAWRHTLGWSADELATTPFLELVHPDDVERTEAALGVLKEDRHVLGFENRYRCRDGTYRWLQWNAAPLVERKLVVATVRDVTGRKEAEAELAHRALHDSLTGLPNRTLFYDRLTLSIQKLERTPGTVALCYVDLDGFKAINDSLGHEAGDRVLIEVARRLTASVRAVDTVARLAGDEFVVVCPDIKDDANLTLLARRVLAALAAPLELDGHAVELGASIGIAVARSHRSSADELLREADAAMYEVKRQGRHGFQLYNPAIRRHTVRRATIHQQLRRALEDDGLRLYYQPIVDVLDGRIVGTEALLRLVHPTRGLLLPHEFIDVAEDCELILPLGEWVLREACRQAAAWNQSFGPLEMSVNVSGRQASRRRLSEQVLDSLSAEGLDPAHLCVEVKERVLIEAGSTILGDLRALTEAGVHLALDDFGTGYSSLTHLQRFPIDTVKIDRSFIADLGRGASDSVIVEAITHLAADLHLSTVAEGVEHVSQLSELRALRCSRAQGYLFSEPLAAPDLTELLAGMTMPAA